LLRLFLGEIAEMPFAGGCGAPRLLDLDLSLPQDASEARTRSSEFYIAVLAAIDDQRHQTQAVGRRCSFGATIDFQGFFLRAFAFTEPH
jgi:hypothetical protein